MNTGRSKLKSYFKHKFNFSCFSQFLMVKSWIWDVVRIRDPRSGKKIIPDPWGKRHRIPDPEPQHCEQYLPALTPSHLPTDMYVSTSATFICQVKTQTTCKRGRNKSCLYVRAPSLMHACSTKPTRKLIPYSAIKNLNNTSPTGDQYRVINFNLFCAEKNIV
jgi:hypothetical protein